MGVPETHTIEFTAGDALKFEFQIQDEDLDFPEDPPVNRNMTGWSALSQIRLTPTASEVITEWAIEELDDTGVIRMKLTGAQTQPFAALGSLISDVQLTNLDGDPETVLRIALEAVSDVTRE